MHCAALSESVFSIGVQSWMLVHAGRLRCAALSESVYVGDAAGRKKGGDRVADDFSDSDRVFVKNVGIRFQTPEEVLG